MAPKPQWAPALLALLLLACGGKKAAEEQAPDLAAIRAHRDSVRALAVADSTARARFISCSDSVLKAMQKTAEGKKKLATKVPEGMIRPEVLSACGKPPAAPAPTQTATATDSTKPVEAAAAPKSNLTPQQQQVLRADSARRMREQTKADSTKRAVDLAQADSVKRAQADSVRTDSIHRARETEVLRETFTYSGGSRDPFVSLISSAKVGPEFSDLLLVGIYLDLRRASNSVAVLRDKSSNKRYKLRVGDQVGRLRVAQIRQLDVVFTVEDFGFERQETLSIRRPEASTQ